MADLGSQLEDIARLVGLVQSRNLSELVIEDTDRRIVVRGAASREADGAPASYEWHKSAELASAAGSPHADEVALTSPMIGVFYRSAGPEQPPYVEVGDHIDVGQTIGIIEAMKVFSEVPADRAGLVTRVLADNGMLVRDGEPILFVRPV